MFADDPIFVDLYKLQEAQRDLNVLLVQRETEGNDNRLVTLVFFFCMIEHIVTNDLRTSAD